MRLHENCQVNVVVVFIWLVFILIKIPFENLKSMLLSLYKNICVHSMHGIHQTFLRGKNDHFDFSTFSMFGVFSVIVLFHAFAYPVNNTYFLPWEANEQKKSKTICVCLCANL